MDFSIWKDVEWRHLNRTVQSTAHLESLLLALEAVSRAHDSRTLVDSDRSLLNSCLEHRAEIVWIRTGDYLAFSSNACPELLNLVGSLATSSKAEMRYRACIIMADPNASRPRALDLLKPLLHDRSVRVARKAVDAVLRRRLRELVPDLEILTEASTDSQLVKVTMMSRDLLSHGEFREGDKLTKLEPDGSLSTVFVTDS